ncbi:MAG: hypothetical protein V3S06_02150 [candidate division Zixibacteria bacterium]
MKKTVLMFILILLIPLCFKSFGVPIVNNFGSSGEDSLTFNILNLLPSGNPATKLDSAYFTVFKSNSNNIIFRDSAIGVSMAGVDSFVIGGDVVYYFHRAVADIDGSGINGTYSYNFLSVFTDSSMRTTTQGQFQVVGWELDDLGDSTGLAARNSAKSLDSLHLMIDSLMAVLDTLQNQDNWVAKEASLYDPSIDSVIVDGTEFAVLNGVITSTNLSGSGLDAMGEATWRNIDTTHIDTSLIGKWLSTSEDSAQVASIIWNTPQSNHTIAGTFGKYLDAEISGLSSGGGAYSYQLVTYDTGVSQVIPGVSLSVRNLDQSALIAVGTSDALGSASFNLNAASYVAIASSPGYIFENFDTVVVAGAGVDSVYGYQFDPGTPADPSLCRVYGYLYNIEGNPESSATVAAWLPSGVTRLGTTIVSPFRKESTTDATGYFYIDLIPSANLTPTDSKYEIAITLSDGTVLRERILVPDLSSWMLTW